MIKAHTHHLFTQTHTQPMSKKQRKKTDLVMKFSKFKINSIYTGLETCSSNVN